MAWIRWRETKGGRRLATVQWRDAAGRVRSQALGTGDEAVAEAHRRGIELTEERGGRAEGMLAPRDALARFLEHVAATRRPATVGFYRDQLDPLVTRLERVPLARWRGLDLDEHLHAAGKEWTPRKLQMVINAAGRFERWCRAAGVPVGSLTASARRPRVRTAEKATLSDAEEARLLAAIAGHRHELPVLLALHAGLAVGDVRALQWGDVDLETQPGWIRRAREKTGAPIVVALSPRIRAVLERKRAVAGPVCRDLPATPNGMWSALARLFVKAKIEKVAGGGNGWHRLRHTFGTRLARAGADLATIQRAMGHRHGSPVTLAYLHASEQEIAAATSRAFGG